MWIDKGKPTILPPLSSRKASWFSLLCNIITELPWFWVIEFNQRGGEVRSKYPVNGDLLIWYARVVSFSIEQFFYSHGSQIINQVISLLQLKFRQNHFSCSSKIKHKKEKSLSRYLCAWLLCSTDLVWFGFFAFFSKQDTDMQDYTFAFKTSASWLLKLCFNKLIPLWKLFVCQFDTSFIMICIIYVYKVCYFEQFSACL